MGGPKADSAASLVEARIASGIDRYQAGDLDAAAAEWREAAEGAPQDERARAYLAWIEWRRRELGQAPAPVDRPRAHEGVAPLSTRPLETPAPHHGEEAPVRAFLSRTPTQPDLPPLDVPELSDGVIDSLAAFASGAAPSGAPPLDPETVAACVRAARLAIEGRELDFALEAAERAVSAAGGPDGPGARDHARDLQGVYETLIGDRSRTVRIGRGAAPDPRSAFLISRVDGTFTIDELVSVSGMPMLEATRLIALLLHQGVLAI